MNKSIWTSDQIPDQTGKVVIVTGSSSGIGYEAARVIANKNAEVIIAVRNRKKGDFAADKIKMQNRNAKVSLKILDLADLSSIRNFAEDFKKEYNQLDLLINNAGVMVPPHSKTKDGFELQMGTNHLGHFALTGLLMDLLTQTNNSRIVNVSSGAHNYGKINFDDLTWEKRKYKAMRAYGDSKLANLYFTYKLGAKSENNGKYPIVTAAHPGWTATELQRHNGLFNFLNPYFAMTLEQGTLPTLMAAYDIKANNGDYYGPDGFLEMRGNPKKVGSSKLSKNKSIAKKLWDISEELTGVNYN